MKLIRSHTLCFYILELFAINKSISTSYEFLARVSAPWLKKTCVISLSLRLSKRCHLCTLPQRKMRWVFCLSSTAQNYQIVSYAWRGWTNRYAAFSPFFATILSTDHVCRNGKTCGKSFTPVVCYSEIHKYRRLDVKFVATR